MIKIKKKKPIHSTSVMIWHHTNAWKNQTKTPKQNSFEKKSQYFWKIEKDI